MATHDLVFPRTIYRGLPDHLGQGPHAHPETGDLVGETKRCESPDQLDADLNAGWRLTRETDDVVEGEASGDESAPAGAAPRKRKK